MRSCEMPDAVEGFVAWLKERGFALMSEEVLDHVSRWFEMTDGGVRIRVECDRCEWNVLIATHDELRVPRDWQIYLGGSGRSEGEDAIDELSDVEDQIEFLRTHLDDVERAAAQPGVDAEIDRIGQSVVRRFWGWEP